MGDEQPVPARAPVELGPRCPNCGEPWLRPTNLPGRYRCVYCLHRFELSSVCPNCGEHSTIVRMSSTAILMQVHHSDCGAISIVAATPRCAPSLPTCS